MLSVDGGRIGSLKSGCLPVSVFKKLTTSPISCSGKLLAQLQAAHHVHCLRQGGGFAIVEVRVGQFDIAQRRHLEGKPIGIAR